MFFMNVVSIGTAYLRKALKLRYSNRTLFYLENARDSFESLFNETEDLNALYGLALTRFELADHLMETNSRLAEGYLERALEHTDILLDNLRDRNVLGKSYLLRSRIFYYLDEDEDALSSVRQAQKLLSSSLDKWEASEFEAEILENFS